MRSYTEKNPVFSDNITIVEETDPVNADNNNAAPMQLLQNDLVLSAMIGNIIMAEDIVIPTEGWVDDSGYRYVEIKKTDVNEDMIPMAMILPECIDTAKKCGLLPTCQIANGVIRFFGKSNPEADININLVLFNKPTVSEGAGSVGGGGSTDYLLKPATADRLGGVKIGNGVDVEEDGTISVDGIEALNDMMATDDDIENTLNSIFGPE